MNLLASGIDVFEEKYGLVNDEALRISDQLLFGYGVGLTVIMTK